MTDDRLIEQVSSHSIVDADADDPLDRFDRWMIEACKSEPSYPEAAALATIDRTGEPGVRIVLVKAYDPTGLTFFTDYRSDKGQALKRHPKAVLCFYWKTLARQVRVSGPVVRVAATVSDAYFAGRDRGSQIGAWASEQSRICHDPEALPSRCAELATRFRDRAVPRPLYWGGYRLVPERWEFWREGANRLHCRDIFVTKDDLWVRSRLNP